MRFSKRTCLGLVWTFAMFYVGVQFAAIGERSEGGEKIRDTDARRRSEQRELASKCGRLIESRRILDPTPSSQHVVYNRIPKCGSTTVLRVFSKLAKQNNFTFIHSLEFHNHSLSQDQEDALVSDLSRVNGPWLYDRHVKFMNFTGYSWPWYINLFREPVERRVSRYYYNDRRHEHMNITFDECVERHQLTRCITPHSTLQYFCGPEELCAQDSEEAFSRAKQNIETHYKVVGVTDDMDSFFELLEFHFPKMFTGAVDVYRRTKPGNVDPNQRPKTVKDSTRQLLNEKLFYELQLYEFISQRLYKDINKVRKLSQQ